ASITGGATPRTFTKNGNGFLTLAVGSFGGAGAVNQGILRIGGFVTSPSIFVSANTELQLFDGFFGQNTNIVLDPNVAFGTGPVLRNVFSNSIINQLVLGFANSVVVDSGTLSINSITDGAAFRGWSKNGVGTVSLAGEGTYDGNTLVNNGTLIARHSLALGTGRAVVAAPATLALGKGTNNATPIDLAGTLAVDTFGTAPA